MNAWGIQWNKNQLGVSTPGVFKPQFMQEHIVAIKSFVECFETPDTVPKLMWELLSAGITSDYADDWDKNKRADMLLLYEQNLCTVECCSRHFRAPTTSVRETILKIDLQ
jgi:hypothetical protein